MSVHDEIIHDTMYNYGWKAWVSASAVKGSNKKVSSDPFIHYLEMNDRAHSQGTRSSNRPPVSLVDWEPGDQLAAEEITCTRRTLGQVHAWYRNSLSLDPSRQTLLSVCRGDLKSPCFEVPCFCLRSSANMLRTSTFVTADGEPWVVGGSGEFLSLLAECICDIDVTPIMSQTPSHIVRELGSAQEIPVVTSGFYAPTNSTIKVLGDPTGTSGLKTSGEPLSILSALYSQCYEGWHDGEPVAVRTATATISVVLTPRSLYGGKNPETKEVSIAVHTVALGQSGWNPSVIVPCVK